MNNFCHSWRLYGFRALLLIIASISLMGCAGGDLPLSHTENLDEEFSVKKMDTTDSFQAYLELEERLFRQLDEQIYDQSPPVKGISVDRYRRGSMSDPAEQTTNWNRTFELEGSDEQGAILLLHGMSDSPYSLRSLGQDLNQRGFRVLGLRLPGHGTAPSGMTRISWKDMAAAVQLSMMHLKQQVGDRPIHIIGYSTGAALALDYVLETEPDEVVPMPSSLVLISPAIGITAAAGLAKWNRRFSLLPGLGKLAWLQVEPEFDPYKYNSFATNAADQIHNLTLSVAQRIENRTPGDMLPPILVLKSTVDATVSNDAVVDRLLSKLSADRHQLVLFDLNRQAADARILIDDPGPFTRRMLEADQLPFSLKLVTNVSADSQAVEVLYKAPFSSEPSEKEALEQQWPDDVYSLSHVAMPFSPDDPLYGDTLPADRSKLFLGKKPLQGERGVLRVSSDYLVRLRHNPFYDYMEQLIFDWVSE